MSAFHFHLRLFSLALLAPTLLAFNSADAALFGRDWNDQALSLAPEKSGAEGDWRANVEVLKGNRRSGINIEIREDRSTYGFYLPTERAPRIEGKTSNGSAVQFTIEAESGDLQFNGVVKNKIASGRYVFEPDKQYAADAGKLLKVELTNDELLKLAFARISIGYIRGVSEALPSAKLEDIVRLRNFGLEPDGIKAYIAAGFAKPDEMTRLRSHGVTPEYATKARDAGYGKTVEDLTR